MMTPLNLQTLTGIAAFGQHMRGKLTRGVARDLYDLLRPECGLGEWFHALEPCTNRNALLDGPDIDFKIFGEVGTWETLVDACYVRGYAEVYDPPQPSEAEGYEVNAVWLDRGRNFPLLEITEFLSSEQLDAVAQFLLEARE